MFELKLQLKLGDLDLSGTSTYNASKAYYELVLSKDERDAFDTMIVHEAIRRAFNIAIEHEPEIYDENN